MLRGSRCLTDKAEVLLADEAPIHELDELRDLIAAGHERGFVTIEEITTCLEEVEVTKEQVPSCMGTSWTRASTSSAPTASRVSGRIRAQAQQGRRRAPTGRRPRSRRST